MGKRIRCRDEDSGVECDVRKKCLRKNSGQAETERESPKVIEEFEAKRDLKSEAEGCVDCLQFWSAQTLFSGRCEAITKGMFVFADVTLQEYFISDIWKVWLYD